MQEQGPLCAIPQGFRHLHLHALMASHLLLKFALDCAVSVGGSLRGSENGRVIRQGLDTRAIRHDRALPFS